MEDRTQEAASPDGPPAAPLVRTQLNRLTLPRWTAWRLVGSWGIYWSALAAYELLPAAWRVLTAEILHRHDTVTLDYSGGLLLPALVIAGPPLLLSLAWLATRPPRKD